MEKYLENFIKITPFRVGEIIFDEIYTSSKHKKTALQDGLIIILNTISTFSLQQPLRKLRECRPLRCRCNL